MTEENEEVVGIIIGIYGDQDKWMEKAKIAAQKSRQTDPFTIANIAYHPTSLAKARNDGAAQLNTPYFIFLDADDSLDSKYVEEMRKGKKEIRRPSTLGYYPDENEPDNPLLGLWDTDPVMIPKRDILTANYIVIGAMLDAEAFKAVGGFRELPILEDWDLFRRMMLAGAQVEEIHDAIYNVTVNKGSRNTDEKLHAEVYAEIVNGR